MRIVMSSIMRCRSGEICCVVENLCRWIAEPVIRADRMSRHDGHFSAVRPPMRRKKLFSHTPKWRSVEPYSLSRYMT